MFFNKSSAAVVVAALSTGALAVNNLAFVYSQGDFSTISGPSGNESGHSSGFTLMLQDGSELFKTSSPNGGTTCANVDDGTQFGITSTCWEGTFTFHCKGNFAGDPNTCYVKDADGIEWDGEKDSSTTFTGISIAQDGWCGGEFYAGPDDCTADDTYTVVKV